MFLTPAPTVQQFHSDSLHRGRVILFVKTIFRHNFILLQAVQQSLKHLGRFGVVLKYRQDPVFLVLLDQKLVCGCVPGSHTVEWRMFLSLSIVYREFRYQVGFILLELPLPAVRNALHSPFKMLDKIDTLVPVPALPSGLCPYQCPKLGFAKQVFSGPTTRGPPETPNPVVGESLESQQL